MTMCWWLKLLAFGFVFLDTEMFVAGQSGSTPSPGLATTENPSALPPSDPLPARTTAFSPTSISEREHDSSETSPALSPGNTRSQVFLDSFNNASVPDMTGVTSQRSDLLTHTVAQAPSAGSTNQTPSSNAGLTALTPAPGRHAASGLPAL